MLTNGGIYSVQLEELQDRPIISFEGLCFFSGVLVSLMAVIQNLESSEAKGAGNFFTGIPLAVFGCILISRIVNHGVAVQNRDTGMIKLIEAILLAGGFTSTLIAVCIALIGIETYSGLIVSAMGCLIFFASLAVGYIKYSNLEKLAASEKSQKCVEQEDGSNENVEAV
jgi:hypothetical protein